MTDNCLPSYLNYIFETDDGEISIEPDGFIDDRVNEVDFYPRANKIFKEKIGDNLIYSNYYNECCQRVMGCDDDFCGKFNRDYYEIAHNRLNSCTSAYTKDKSDNFVNFFNTIFKVVICNEYNRILNKSNKKINAILKNYSRVDKNKCEDNCSVCADKLKKNVSLKPPCGHITHRKCLKKWFYTSVSCPLCRGCFV